MMDLRDLFRRLGWSGVATLAVVLAGAGILAGGAVVGLGLYNVSARAGHLPGVSWILHATFRNSVALRADATPPEDLDSADMVALGAGHYEQACAECHARPQKEQTATTAAMVPRPPHLFRTDLSAWSAAELHWIVYQGVKMSGMPHWPASRRDDVWPVVAFLRQTGGLDAEGYAELTGGQQRGRCSMCHGADGVSTNPQVPRLDILSPDYIAASLRAYRDGDRDSGIMAQAASTLDDQAIRRLASGFGALGAPNTADGTTDQDSLAGRDLAMRPSGSRVPACQACHGPWPKPLDPAFPALSGQHADYLETQLRLWRDGARGGGRAAELMHHAARELTDRDISALAAYYASRPPERIND